MRMYYLFEMISKRCNFCSLKFAFNNIISDLIKFNIPFNNIENLRACMLCVNKNLRRLQLKGDKDN